MTIIPTRGLTAAVITAGLALSATIAVTAPAAHARPNPPQSAHDSICELEGNLFEQDVNKAWAQYQAGQDYSAALAQARADLAAARGEGCEWAARTAPPKVGTRLTPSIPIPPPAI